MKMSTSPWGMRPATSAAASYSAPSTPTLASRSEQRASYQAPVKSGLTYATTRLGEGAEPPPPRPLSWGMAIGWAAVVAAAAGIFYGVTQEGPWFSFGSSPRRNGKPKRRSSRRRSSRLRANGRRRSRRVSRNPIVSRTIFWGPRRDRWYVQAPNGRTHLYLFMDEAQRAARSLGTAYGMSVVRRPKRVAKSATKSVTRNARRSTGRKVSAVMKAAGGIATIRNLGVTGAPAASKLGQKRYDMLVRRGPGLYRISAGRSPSVIKFKTASPQGAITNTRIASNKSGESHWLVKVFPSGRPRAIVVRYITGDGKTKFRVEEYAAQAYERVAGYSRRVG